MNKKKKREKGTECHIGHLILPNVGDAEEEDGKKEKKERILERGKRAIDPEILPMWI